MGIGLEGLEERVVELVARHEDCRKLGYHVYRDVGTYNPKFDRHLISCVVCGAMDERRGTAEERKSYQGIFKLEINI